jgi:hypothetical protein
LKQSNVHAMLLLTILLSSSNSMILVTSDKHTIFYENSDDWEIEMTEVEDSENQRIVQTASVSGNKSLQLQTEGDVSISSRSLTLTGNLIGFQVFVMKTSRWYVQTWLAFHNSVTETGFSMVCFDFDWIYAWAYDSDEGRYTWIPLQEYDANNWYNVTVVTSRDTFVFNVWINGIKRGMNLEEEPDRHAFYGPIDSVRMHLLSGHSVKVYFDDISIFEQSQPSPQPPPSDGSPEPSQFLTLLSLKTTSGVATGVISTAAAKLLGVPGLLSAGLAGFGAAWFIPFALGGFTSAIMSEIAAVKFGWSPWNSALFGTALGSSVSVGTAILIASALGISLTPIGWGLAATIALGVLVSFTFSYLTAASAKA